VTKHQRPGSVLPFIVSLESIFNMYKTVYTEVEVDVELSDFDTDDLIEELENRGLDYNTKGVDGDEMRELLERIWLNRRQGKDYQFDLDRLIYGVLGKVM
jgi:hypothetical protein